MIRVKLEDLAKQPGFWRFFLSTAFPDAYNPNTDTSLAGYIRQNFSIPENLPYYISYPARDTENALSGQPVAADLPLLHGSTARIEFHPGVIRWYLDGELLGETGERTLPYHRFLNLTDHTKMDAAEPDPIPLLLLPVVRAGIVDLPDATRCAVAGLLCSDIPASHFSHIVPLIILHVTSHTAPKEWNS